MSAVNLYGAACSALARRMRLVPVLAPDATISCSVESCDAVPPVPTSTQAASWGGDVPKWWPRNNVSISRRSDLNVFWMLNISVCVCFTSGDVSGLMVSGYRVALEKN